MPKADNNCGIFGPIPHEPFEVFHGFFDSSEVFGMFRPFLSASRFVRRRSTRHDALNILVMVCKIWASASSLFRLLSSELVAKKVATK
jgi:hypothetical protein